MKRTTLRMLGIGLTLGCVFLVPRSVHAQGSNLFGGSGTTRGGTGGISGNLTGSGFSSGGSAASGRGATGGMGGMGGSSMGGLGGAGGARGGLGGGAAGGLGGGMTGATGLGGSGTANPFGTGNSGMVGRNSGMFAGNAQAQQGINGAGGRATRNFGSGNSSGQRNNQFSQNQSAERTTSMVRPRQCVAFEYNVKSPAAIANRVTTQLTKIGDKNPGLKRVEVRLDNDQLVLSGTVETTEQSRLAASLLRLEPGVRSVRNEIEIEKPAIPE